MMVNPRTSSEIQRAMADYFDASTEALEMCKQLLQNIKNTQSNYQSVDNFLANITDSATSTSASDPLALISIPVRSNPFCTTTQSKFSQMHDHYSSILQSIRSSHRRVARKLKILKAVKKWSRKTMSLMQLQEQLDTAAKGTYVLARYLDTVSSLTARLSDGIDRENALARCCEERSGERSSVMKMVNEIRKSCLSSRTLADELEEHVCMFHATINRARIMVTQEISEKP